MEASKAVLYGNQLCLPFWSHLLMSPCSTLSQAELADIISRVLPSHRGEETVGALRSSVIRYRLTIVNSCGRTFQMLMLRQETERVNERGHLCSGQYDY